MPSRSYLFNNRSHDFHLSQSNKNRNHQKAQGQHEQNQLEQYGFSEPLRKAYVGKAQAHQQGATGGIQNVGISVSEQIGQYNNRFADALDGCQGKHGYDQNRLCGCAGNKKLHDQHEYVQNDHRNIGGDIGNGVIKIVEDGVQYIALLRYVGNTEGYHNDDDGGEDVLHSLCKAFTQPFIRAQKDLAYNNRAHNKCDRHKHHCQRSE